MGQTILSLIPVFQRMLETEITYKLLMEIYKESLRGQKFCEKTIWIEPNCILWFFCHTPVLENQVQIASFKGPYGSSMNDTVHSVQMDNLIHQDNTG